MLISFDSIVRKYRMNITGFIQVGAHFGEELEDFRKVLNGSNENIHLFEPLTSAYNELAQKKQQERLYNVALGASEKEVEMFVDAENQGQSSSILEPALHLTQYPDITFPGKEKAKMKTLDSFKITRANALWMDVQGYELEVLKGAVKTLEYIDYVYTEVNVDEVYKGCARLSDLDEFLAQYGFQRMVLDLSGKTWGDALYIKKKMIADNETIEIPYEFRQRTRLKYPPDNEKIFEEWFADGVVNDDFDGFSEYAYLPVYWTGYYCNNLYGNNPVSIKKLQDYLDSLSNKKKYFTIVQYDDGILNDFRDKDVTVFSMGGGGAAGRNVKVVPIGLLGTKHQYDYTGIRKDIMCNFIGDIATHPIRKEMQDFMYLKPDFYFHFNEPLDKYCLNLARSYFTLAPRGYGRTSFRIWEALQYKSIPIYITKDEPFLPAFYDHNNKPCMIICTPAQAEDKMRATFANQQLYRELVQNGQDLFNEFYNYESMAQFILSYLFQTQK